MILSIVYSVRDVFESDLTASLFQCLVESVTGSNAAADLIGIYSDSQNGVSSIIDDPRIQKNGRLNREIRYSN